MMKDLTELNQDDRFPRISAATYDIIASILKAMSIAAVLLVGLEQ